MFKKFNESTRFFSSEDNLDNFVSLVIGTLVILIFNFRCSIFYFELKGIVNTIGVVLVKFSVEKLFKYYTLIVSQGKVLAPNEGWEKSEMFGRHISFGLAGLLEKWLDLKFDSLLVDHVLDWFGIVLEDSKQTLLDKGLIYFVWIRNKILKPSWEENFIVLEIFDNVLNQNITQLEDLCYFHPLGFIICYLIIADNLVERVIERIYNLHQNLSNTCFHQNLLNLFNRTAAWRLNLIIVSIIYLSD